MSTLPQPPPGAGVTLQEERVGMVAARAFTGLAFQDEVASEAEALL